MQLNKYTSIIAIVNFIGATSDYVKNSMNSREFFVKSVLSIFYPMLVQEQDHSKVN